MTDAVETMAYANEVPWHGLGNKVTNNLSPEQMLKSAQLDWTVSKQGLYFKKKDGSEEKIPDKYVLVRDSDQSPLTMVGSTYKPVQNDVAMEFFKKFVVAGKMKMETAGSLWNGRYIWGLARLGTDFTLGKSDDVQGYLLMCQPHVHGKAMVMQFTPIRVVCWNTLSFALGSNLKGKPGAFRMPHSQVFNDAVKSKAEEALGLATGQMEEFQQAAALLCKKKVTEPKVEEYFCEVLKFDKKAAEKEGAREPLMLPKFRAALTHAPGQQMPTALGTWWGAVNAVSYVIDHQTGRERSTSLRNAWLGHTAGIKRDALSLALKRAA